MLDADADTKQIQVSAPTVADDEEKVDFIETPL